MPGPEVVGASLAVFPLMQEIMSVANIASEVACIKDESESLALCRTRLYVEKARLGEFARILSLMTKAQDGPHNNEEDHLMQRTMTSALEKLLEAQVHIPNRGHTKHGNGNNDNHESPLSAYGEKQLDGLITDLAHLNDALYRLISLHQLTERSGEMPWNPNTELAQDQVSVSMVLLVEELSSVSEQALRGLGKAMPKSMLLRRTFQRAADRLSVWRNDFDFDISQMETVLGSNEYLYKIVVGNFADLVLLCWELISVGFDNGYQFSTTVSTTLGRTMERIKTVARNLGLHVGGYDQSGGECHLLFEVDTNEDDFRRIETSIKADVNGYCSSLYGMIGAIDSARKRQLWLEQLGLQNNAYRNPLMHESTASETVYASLNRRASVDDQVQTGPDGGPISVANVVEDMLTLEQSQVRALAAVDKAKPSEIEAAATLSVQDLLASNFEAATELHSHLRTRHQKTPASRSSSNSVNKPAQETLPTLVKDVQDQLQRLNTFRTDVGPKLPGLETRNSEIQQSMIMTLEHMGRILDKARKEEKDASRTTWIKLPKKRVQELNERHEQIQNTASAIKGFEDLNDALETLGMSVMIPEPVLVYKSSPAV